MINNNIDSGHGTKMHLLFTLCFIMNLYYKQLNLVTKQKENKLDFVNGNKPDMDQQQFKYSQTFP